MIKIETLENAIQHINTAIDIDPWAKQTAVEAMRYMIASLVSKPERIRGRWIIMAFMTAKCSACHVTLHDMECANFCPNCGADMREGNT